MLVQKCSNSAPLVHVFPHSRAMRLPLPQRLCYKDYTPQQRAPQAVVQVVQGTPPSS